MGCHQQINNNIIIRDHPSPRSAFTVHRSSVIAHLYNPSSFITHERTAADFVIDFHPDLDLDLLTARSHVLPASSRPLKPLLKPRFLPWHFNPRCSSNHASYGLWPRCWLQRVCGEISAAGVTWYACSRYVCMVLSLNQKALSFPIDQV